ncbi:hypothetical protein ACF1GS_37150 [Streptomyces eurythermus]|jgi:hypothetical protein|uniref:hypothetical protein n=1 Tax=Streptomyces TaxID=1883 RepID=UPI0022849442|nr:hypothetical protein [Streptomyces sp. UMAF16]
MSDHSPAPYTVALCVEELRAALALHGITLPSLQVDLPSFADSHSAGLVSLGNCNTTTARALAAALRKAADE